MTSTPAAAFPLVPLCTTPVTVPAAAPAAASKISKHDATARRVQTANQPQYRRGPQCKRGLRCKRGSKRGSSACDWLFFKDEFRKGFSLSTQLRRSRHRRGNARRG